MILCHIVVICCRYPSHDQLQIIYSTYLMPVLRQQLAGHSVWNNQSRVHALASSMIQLYDQIRSKFTVDQYSHYQFTPRDLTAWVVGLLRYNLAGGQRDSSPETVMMIWAHEAIRLFRDRLVGEETCTQFDNILVTIIRNDWSVNVIDTLASMYQVLFTLKLCTHTLLTALF